jgi:hypothetical protein
LILTHFDAGEKRTREEYDWEEDAPTSDTPAPNVVSNSNFNPGYAAPQPQEVQYPAPEGLVLLGKQRLKLFFFFFFLICSGLDVSVLSEVEEVIKELSAEELREMVVDNMGNFGGVGARPGDAAYFDRVRDTQVRD